MRIEIPKIIKPLWLKEYAPEFGEVKLDVWVNPPEKLLKDFAEAAKQVDIETSTLLIGELWNCPADDVKRLESETADTDPMLFTWCISKSFELIKEHRKQIKKN
jgi:hypothetical protein